MSMRMRMRRAVVLAFDRNTICGNNRFRKQEQNCQMKRMSYLSLIQFSLCHIFFCSLVIYTASLLAIQRIMSVRIVTLIGPVSLFFCLHLLSSSPSFRWFCKMFVCRFKQKTIHLRFIRFHERELLSVHTGFCLAIIIAGWHCCFK